MSGCGGRAARFMDVADVGIIIDVFELDFHLVKEWQ